MMAFVTVEDLYGQMEVIVFPNIYDRFAKYLSKESQILVEGRISIKEDEQPKILADKISLLESINMTGAAKGYKSAQDNNQINYPTGNLGNDFVYEQKSNNNYRQDETLNNGRVSTKSRTVKVLFDAGIEESKRNAALAMMKYFQGTDRALVYIDEATKPKLRLNVHISDLLIGELIDLLGSDKVKY
jgi:DNA polymerase-3 subunit alpha